MQDPKFEKQVKEKMDELFFPPSEAVWAKVDAGIKKERKRRRPLLWFFLFLGLSLAGSVYFMGNHSKNNLPVSSAIDPNQKIPEINSPEDDLSGINSSPIMPKQAIQKNEKTEADISPIIPVQKNKEGEGSGSYAILTPKKQKTGIAKEHEIKYHRQHKKLKSNLAENIVEDSYAENKKQPDHKEDIPLQETTPGIAGIKEDTAAVAQGNIPDPFRKNKKTADVANSVAGKDSSIKAMTRKNRKSSWQLGFLAGAGIAGMHESFKGYNVLPAAGVVVPPSANPYPYLPSSIKARFSFEAGVVIKKSFTKRITFITGLNYQYYSTEIKTGQYINRLAYVSSYNLSLIPAAGYYQNSNGGGSNYVNRYHFVELPVGVSFGLNTSRKNPFHIETGISLAYLLGTSALQFDPSSGIYYKNNNAFQKTQVNGFTAVTIGFPLYGLQVQAGPQLQYGITDMLPKNSYDHQHLLFTGVKFMIMPARKK